MRERILLIRQAPTPMSGAGFGRQEACLVMMRGETGEPGAVRKLYASLLNVGRSRLRELCDDSGGQSATEFALVLVPLMLLVTGIVVFSNLYRQHQTLVGATEAAGRFEAICNGLPSTNTQTASTVGQNAATGITASFSFNDLTTGTTPGTGYNCRVASGDQIKVTGTSHQSVNLYVWNFGINLTSSMTVTEQ